MHNEILNTRLKDLREEANLTQTDMAKIFNMHKNTYWRYETEASPMPLQVAKEFADYFNVSLDYFSRRTNFKYIPDKENSVKFAQAIQEEYNKYMKGKI